MTLRKTTQGDRGGVAPFRPLEFNAPGQAEHLVGLGFRCWMAGFETSDIACWETGWNAYVTALGPAQAKPAITELACWVRTLRSASCRKLSYMPFGCSGFCRDESIAISMIAACQHSACPAQRACAFALLGCSNIEEVVDSASAFADALRIAGQELLQTSICDVTMLVDAPVGASVAHAH